jgi:putative glutamine amidotransferase
MRPRILVPGRTLPAGKASRHAVVFAGVRYCDALHRAGAMEMVVGPRSLRPGEAEALLDEADGLLLMGGPDIDPALFGEEARPETYGVHRNEDDFEIALVRAAVARGLPTLAICRGMQLLNVAFGGSLDQHISDQPGMLSHASQVFPKPEPDSIGPLQPVEIDPNCRLARVLGSTTTTGAHSHHQAVARVGDGLVAVGRCDDGVVEVVEHESGWVVGVQWHPEDTAADDPQQQQIFDAFVASAAGAQWDGVTREVEQKTR